MSAPRSQERPGADAHGALFGALLSELSGAALVCDSEQTVVAATDAAREALGIDPEGSLLAQALGQQDAVGKLVASVARGEPARARVIRPTGVAVDAELSIRSVPLRLPGDARVHGTLVYIDSGNVDGESEDELFQGMWSRAQAMKDVFRLVERVAADDVTVLVRGETGTGKELVARAVHNLSLRKDGPFRAINCAALPPHLLESELFGHVKGAFTGAVRDTPGHIQLADKGTLFLDEVAELPLELQAKLLRVLETRTFIPVGGREPQPVDVRIVSATHRALRKEVEAGRFRADLMYRLRVIPIFLPALRERPEDIELIAMKLIAQMNPSRRRTVKEIAPSALEALRQHGFPGNVRELSNVLAYAFAVGDGERIEVHELPPEITEAQTTPASEPTPIRSTPEMSREAQRVVRALESASGNREHAARLLGMSRVTLWRRMKALGIEG